ncbi:hypothetical protein ANN_06150 [Periplaneta americana]|uniref:Uncharacterized protein n=1 Tax=Periplaneta americana TaxID=6978 RepID=A0ABQ8TCR7_PERAM|nr:hypothetical protein ANN_06150 [Periplaneta americana]
MSWPDFVKSVSYYNVLSKGEITVDNKTEIHFGGQSESPPSSVPWDPQLFFRFGGSHAKDYIVLANLGYMVPAALHNHKRLGQMMDEIPRESKTDNNYYQTFCRNERKNNFDHIESNPPSGLAACVVFCGAETWTLRRSEEKRLEAFEMLIWRQMEHVKWTDKIRNEAVLERIPGNCTSDALHLLLNTAHHSSVVVQQCYPYNSTKIPFEQAESGTGSYTQARFGPLCIYVYDICPSPTGEPSFLSPDRARFHLRREPDAVHSPESQALTKNLYRHRTSILLPRLHLNLFLIIFIWLFNDVVSTTKLFSVDGIGGSEMIFGEMRPRIRHRLPDIRHTIGESLGKKPNQLELVHEVLSERYPALVNRNRRPLGRPRRRWEDNIKMDLREVGYDDRDWINLAQDKDRWRAYVMAAMNLQVP